MGKRGRLGKRITGAKSTEAQSKRVRVDQSANFDAQRNRRSHQDVLNRRIPGQGRNVAGARKNALKVRKQSLLRQYKAQGRANTFMDMRFGEGDKSLSVDQKALLRFQRQREKELSELQRNVDQGGVETGLALLSHQGGDLGARARFEHEIDDDALGKFDAELVDQHHFGGGGDGNAKVEAERTRDPNRPKSRREAMMEMIAKSKQKKAELFMAKERDDEEMERLDDAFNDIAGELFFRAPSSRSAVFVPTSDKERALHKQQSAKAADQYKDYNKYYKSMILEARGAATDRTKSPAEIAREEAARLKKLEASRLRRMNGEKDEEEEEAAEDAAAAAAADDGDGKFALNRGLLGPASDSSDDEMDEVPVRKVKFAAAEAPSAAAQAAAARPEDDEMPFVIRCPASYVTLCRNVRRWCGAAAAAEGPAEVTSASLFRTMLSRIVACSSVHVKMSKDDRATSMVQLGRFAKHLLLLLRDAVDGQGELPFARAELGACADAIHDTMWRLAQDASSVVAGVVLHFLTQLCDRTGLHMLSQSLDAADAAADAVGVSPWASAWPSCGELMVLQLIPALFPGSDKRHVVMTPTLMLVETLLARCPLRSNRDLARGVVLTHVALRFVGDSKRFVGSIAAFVSALLVHATGCAHPVIAAESAAQFCVGRCPSFSTLPARVKPGWIAKAAGVSDLHIMPWMLAEAKTPALAKRKKGKASATDVAVARTAAPVLHGALSALIRVCALYGDLPSFPELLGADLRSALESVAANEQLVNTLTPALRLHFVRATTMFAATCDAAASKRRAIGVQKSSGLSTLKILDPLFSDKYTPGSSQTAVTIAEQVRAEHKALKQTLKQGRKNAARELRRDSEFIGRERDKDVRSAACRALQLWCTSLHSPVPLPTLLSLFHRPSLSTGCEEERGAKEGASEEQTVYGGGCGNAQRDGAEARGARRGEGKAIKVAAATTKDYVARSTRRSLTPATQRHE